MSVSSFSSTLRRSFNSVRGYGSKNSNKNPDGGKDYGNRRKGWVKHMGAHLEKKYNFEYENICAAIDERLCSYGKSVPRDELKAALEKLDLKLTDGSFLALYDFLKQGCSSQLSLYEIKIVICLLSLSEDTLKTKQLVFRLFDSKLKKGFKKIDFNAMVQVLLGNRLSYLLEQLPFGRDAFTQFLHEEMNEELLYCYDDVKKILFDAGVPASKYVEFTRLYIESGSERQVNIGAALRNNMLKDIDKIEKLPALPFKVREYLCQVLEEVIELMEQNSFQSFKNRLLETDMTLADMTWERLNLNHWERMDYKVFEEW
eukprot:CAMPEP_0204869282 /NCGR_PEP_ID=MMETSP1348-20121228/29161_1 /ASSEMBLY_ACC=CAM_ASM_000700 /TAXON_ID=215587 /ORGANISM="Aplanochytrium stocchinoi, Strain GSBS06" /LENGTH=314 /DNA_ID=CAMNT_0052022575 /DNA_START=46 /DNA_END=987 /DNA_ORIENTATION=-